MGREPGFGISARERDLVPVIFDFDLPADRDVTETVTLLADLAKYPWVIAPYRYQDAAHLLETLDAGVLEPAERARAAVAEARAREDW